MLCAFSKQPVPVILDTDISSDVDDVGAVAVLHSLADRGEARILAMMVSSKDPWSASCLSALNTYFKRPDIPIGINKGIGIYDYSKYTKKISNEFKHDTKLDHKAPDAVDLYRKILSAEPDNSVTLISIGYLSNLNHLLKSYVAGMPSGKDLVKRKVKLLVCMGGQYPQGKEWNFYQDPASSKFVIKNWPTKIIFSGFELGENVLSGRGLRPLGNDNPVRQAYKLYNNLKDRPSWDLITVLYGILGVQGGLKDILLQSPKGTNKLYDDGSNYWQAGSGDQTYLIRNTSVKTISQRVENLMVSSLQ